MGTVVVTLILRLLPGPLAHGELVGRAEVVATGEAASLRSVTDLMVLAQGAARRAADTEDARARPHDISSDGGPPGRAPAP